MSASQHFHSSWISQILYKSTPDGCSYLAIILKPRPDPCSKFGAKLPPVAYLYGPDIPSWVPGLLSAGVPKKTSKGVKHSPGRAYWRLLRERGFKGQKVEGKEEVRKLKEMMK